MKRSSAPKTARATADKARSSIDLAPSPLNSTAPSTTGLEDHKTSKEPESPSFQDEILALSIEPFSEQDMENMPLAKAISVGIVLLTLTFIFFILVFIAR